MMNILCLESKNNMVTREQIFEASLFMLVNSLTSYKWNVTAPINVRKASFNKLLEYNTSIESYINNFTNKNALPLLSASLKNTNTDLLKYVPYISNTLINSYNSLNIPEQISSQNIHNYINKVSRFISNNINNIELGNIIYVC